MQRGLVVNAEFRSASSSAGANGARRTVQSLPPRKLFADIKSISKSEIDYVREVFEIIVPVKITWNEDAWKQLQIRVEPIRKSED